MNRYALTVAAGLFGLVACASDDASSQHVHDLTATSSVAADFGARASARLVGLNGDRIGEITAWQGNGGVLIQINANSLPQGFHAAHIHQTGNCEDTDVYKASGGHVGKLNGPHGFLNPNGPHAGDLPNLYANEKGDVNVEFFSPLITVADLTDEDGAAFIIHAERDDHQSQPIGRAGGRIACAPFLPRQ